MTEPTLEEMRAAIADEGAKAVKDIRDAIAYLRANPPKIESRLDEPILRVPIIHDDCIRKNPLIGAPDEITINFSKPRDLPDEIKTVVREQVAKSITGDPILDPNLSFISEDNQERLDVIFDALLTMPQGNYREDLLFCYRVIQRAQIENFKLKKTCRDLKEYAIRTKLLDQRISLR
jgi:hypothetical protein